MTALFLATPYLFTVLIGIIGLLVGSFLNVVIYRLPIMLQRSWRKECIEYLQIDVEEEGETFNLSLPLSRCPHCQSPIKAYQNIPVISYVFLKGQCANCKQPISLRYPLIEL
jgi:leader peptidase (prepilin peptidase)/N-methyltransferase